MCACMYACVSARHLVLLQLSRFDLRKNSPLSLLLHPVVEIGKKRKKDYILSFYRAYYYAIYQVLREVPQQTSWGNPTSASTFPMHCRCIGFIASCYFIYTRTERARNVICLIRRYSVILPRWYGEYSGSGRVIDTTVLLMVLLLVDDYETS